MVFPASIAKSVSLRIASIPAMLESENLLFKSSTDFDSPLRSIFLLTFLPKLSRFLEASSNFNACLSLSKVDRDSLTPDSNCLLSNCISTILLSIV